MEKNIARKLWFFGAICFIIAGIVGEKTEFIVLGCAYICIGSSIKKKTIDKDEAQR
ncbi:hypothetical protein DES36_1025 [Alkalibaculum bacchi]|uniref:Uncharacterized protein n=1 Tax=Alkalibaculum bacchi TaxID=645887 RepID=A0A366IFL7_9FIRM|nr:hypothetical protein [Alkalibaculum bacchi]RBP68867.1 hypothetical protein DES36_1025 [Alkalibaculum bacchi]